MRPCPKPPVRLSPCASPRYAAKDAGLSQVELAKRIGTSASNVAFWELSGTPPRGEVLPNHHSAALTPVVLAAFYSRRVTAWGGAAAICAGTLVTLLWDVHGVRALFPAILAQRDAIFPALFAAVAAMVAVSLFTRAPAPEQLARFSD